MQKIAKYIGLLLTCVLFFSACATVGSLNGGPDDRTPPQILKCEPNMGAVQVKTNILKITFDEFFSLNSATDSVRITPAQQKNPVYSIKGKTLIIELKDSLLKNTTYHIDFTAGVIKDITEGNAQPATSLVFSTGNTLDSFSLKGKVLDAYSQKTIANACVMLYASADDSCPLRDAPTFFTLSDKNGCFSFQHIPYQAYHLYALTDKNFNRRFDLANESFAFLPANEAIFPILLDTADSLSLRKEQMLYLFQETPEKVKLLKNASTEKGIHTFIFNIPTDTFHLEAMQGSTPNYILERNTLSDTLTAYFYDTSRTKIESFLVFYSGGMDTISLNPSGNPIGRTSTNSGSDSTAKKHQPLKIKSESKVEIGENFKIYFDFPIRDIDTSAFVLTEIHRKNKDTNTISSFQIRIDTTQVCCIILDYPLRSSCDYYLFVKDSACVAYNEKYNDTLHLSFNKKGKKEYGNINFWLKISPKSDYIVELVDAQNVAKYTQILVADSIKDDSTKISFVHLKEGKYRLRIIKDANCNKKWDSGKYLLKRDVERIFYTKKEWDVKARITLEETIEITF